MADMEVAMFHSCLVNPPMTINLLITGITRISNYTVATAPSCQENGRNFIKVLKVNCKIRSSLQNFDELAVNVGDELAESSSDDNNDDDDDAGCNPILLRDIVLVAHN